MSVNIPTDQEIKDVFNQAGSIRAVSRAFNGLSVRLIKMALIRAGVVEFTYRQALERIEKSRETIIALYLSKTTTIPQICVKFNIPTKTLLRTALKKWGVYDARARPKRQRKQPPPEDGFILETYNRLGSARATIQELHLPSAIIYAALHRLDVKSEIKAKHSKIESDKESIIRRYTIGKESSQIIAADYGVWKTAILDALKRWGVSIENHKKASLWRIMEENKEEIKSLYLTKAWSLREIAEKFKVKHKVVIRAVKRWGLPVPDNRYKESSLERKFKELLLECAIPFKQHHRIGNRIYDFYLLNQNLIIECNGDFWHGNPRRYTTFTEEQLKGHIRDETKRKLALRYGFDIRFIWESEMNDFPTETKALFVALASGGKLPDQKNAHDFMTDTLTRKEDCSELRLSSS